MVFHLRQNYRYHNSDITIFEGRSILVRCLQYQYFWKYKFFSDNIPVIEAELRFVGVINAFIIFLCVKDYIGS
jgi:hypothetical protein